MHRTLAEKVLPCSIPSGQKLTLIALAVHADDDGANCFPGLHRLMLYTGFSDRGVRNHIESLIEDGWIRRTSSRTGGRGHRIGYIIDAEKVERRSLFEDVKGEPSTMNTVHPSEEKGERRSVKGEPSSTKGERRSAAIKEEDQILPTTDLNNMSEKPEWYHRLRLYDSRLDRSDRWIQNVEKEYPDRNLADDAEDAIAWLIANAHTKRGNKKDIGQFFKNWLKPKDWQTTSAKNGVAPSTNGSKPMKTDEERYAAGELRKPSFIPDDMEKAK